MAPIYAFLYIEPAEVRIEILMPLLTLETWTEVPRKDHNFLEVAEQQAALPAAKEFFRGHNKVVIDGLEVPPVVQRLDFYGVDFKDFAVAAEPRRLSAWTARVGAILTYSTKGMPNQVAVTWDLFNPRVLSARAAVFAGEEAKPCPFHALPAHLHLEEPRRCRPCPRSPRCEPRTRTEDARQHRRDTAEEHLPRF